ncbi:uncharacterized protein [Onthophagus taurus]|uniref:uncharacterized protein n=1 Tax=Onthophagus taurus TaxID=166361 RepID=UPI000C204C6F|nr:31 kDa ribonucleoprotein, chloroplastic-like [Onthophagus taurus]
MGSVSRAVKLYVGNIPWTVGHIELKNYFSKFGPVAFANVIFDRKTGLSRNFGFVMFSNRDGFDKATNTKQHELEGRTLKLQKVHDSTTSNIQM